MNKIYDYDEAMDKVNDVVSSDLMSSCCSAKVYNPTDEWAICMDCKE